VDVLFVTGANPMRGGGGLESYVRAHAHAARAAGFDAHVFCLGAETRVSREQFGSVHQIAVPPHTIRSALAGLYSPLVARALDRHVRHTRPVLIHAFGAHSCGPARYCARRGLPSTLVTSTYTTQKRELAAILGGVRREHGAANAVRYLTRYAIARTIGSRAERQGYDGSRLLLVNYESVRTLLRDEFAADWEIRLMPYASDLAFVSTEEGEAGSEPELIGSLEPADAPLIVSVSRHDGRKGVDVLLHALGSLRASGVAFRACLLGRGELIEAHRRLADRLGLARSVTIPGQVPDVRPYLRRADVYVLPSLSESSGSVSLLEALQAGDAIVTSGCDGIPEDVSDGESALVVPPGDAHALAGAIERLLGDEALRGRLGTNARALYERRFSAAGFTDSLDALYAELGFTPTSSASASS
jgi:glycosyltransferase involved in cell wall biosynthesis